MPQSTHEVTVCIAGGGPAGMLLGLLLAKNGVKTLVLEQHHDFSREYRGEVLMPRFASLFSALGLLDYIESFPHSKIDHAQLRTRNRLVTTFPLAELSPAHPYAIWMPQPILLDALRRKAAEFPAFDLWFGASASQLLQADGQTQGILVKRGDEEIAVKARISIGADGRTSRLRSLGGFELAFQEYKFDLLWFSLPRPKAFDSTVQLMFSGRPYIIAPKYPDLIQCGLVTAPGEFADFRKDLGPLKRILKAGPPEFQALADGLTDLKPFHPLQARIELVKQWAKDGLLLIGDAAHTCSPIGAVGVSIALETATVSASVILDALAQNNVSAEKLAEVQRIREPDVKKVQAIQSRTGELFSHHNPIFDFLLPFIINGAARLGLQKNPMSALITSPKAYASDQRLIFK